MSNTEFHYSDVENIDYRKPQTEFDTAFENLRQAAQNLADHKHGQRYEEKAEEYLRAALPVARLIRSDEASRVRLDGMVSADKITVRVDAHNRDFLRLFKAAQKHVGRATTASERNKWAAILSHAIRQNWDADTMVLKVRRLRGINEAAKAFKLLRAEEPQMHESESEPAQSPVKIKFTVSGLGDDVEIAGHIPAVIAQAVAKRVRASLIHGGV